MTVIFELPIADFKELNALLINSQHTRHFKRAIIINKVIMDTCYFY